MRIPLIINDLNRDITHPETITIVTCDGRESVPIIMSHITL